MHRPALLTAFAAMIAIGAATPAMAQRACPHQESDRETITRTLSAAASCKVAYDLMNACRSNSSGDVGLADVVIAKCEASFLPGLDTRSRQAYQQEREACQRKYAKNSGTMYVSFSITCEAGVAAKYAGAQERRSRGR